MKILQIGLFVIVASFTKLMAQMPHDAIYMPAKNICVAAIGSQSQWSEYWEGALLRDNPNMGTHTTQSAALMLAAGITSKLNIIINLPYISTKTSAGNLMGQKGFQDLSGWLKYKILHKNQLSLHAVLGGSVPVGNYVPEFLPMSIGIQSKTATARLIANYQSKSGLYLQGHASYIVRSNVQLDRDGYLANGKIYNTNQVAIPNATDLRVAFGYYKKGVQLEGFSEHFGCISGDNIRRNDMPFLTNNMKQSVFGAYGKFQPKNLGLNARAGFCNNGLNAGKNTAYSLGILYNIK